MYEPAPYLTHPSCPYQLELLRIRTQHTIHIIPSHLHHAFRAPRTDYQDRVFPHCLDKGTTVLGGAIHIICVSAQQQRGCYSNSLLNSKGSHDYLISSPSRPQASHQTTRITRTGPLQVLQKSLKGWITEATPICNEFAHALRMHVTSLHPAVEDCPLMMKLHYPPIATMFSHLSNFHLVSNQRRCPQMAPRLYLLTPQDNR